MPQSLSLGDDTWGKMHLMGRPTGLYPLGIGALVSTSHGPRVGSSLLPGENSQSPTLGLHSLAISPSLAFYKTELTLGVPRKYSPCPWSGEPRVCQGPEHNLVSAVALLPTDGALQTPASARNPDGPAPSICRHSQQEQNRGFAPFALGRVFSLFFSFFFVNENTGKGG